MKRRIALPGLFLTAGILFGSAADPALGATLCVNLQGAGGCFSRIQDAINAASAGDTLLIKKGSYCENIAVTRPLTLMGEDENGTVISPAVSSPNPCSDSAQCGGAASSIILIQADSVVIRNLTLDGDNPGLRSGVIRGGADLDARNGIMADYAIGVMNGLEVDHVTVRNFYRYGISAASGGTFSFRENTVDNVWGDDSAIGIHNFGGSGLMLNNKVSRCRDAIASTLSSGVRIVGNKVKNSGSGIHVDHSQGADLIQVNEVTDGTPGGYGIQVSMPAAAPQIIGNQITNVDIGLASFGQANADARAAFIDNVLVGKKKARSVGLYVTNDRSGRGAQDLSVLFAGNIIAQYAEGIRFESSPGSTITAEGTSNAVLQSSKSGLISAGGGTNRIMIQWSNFSDNQVAIGNQTGGFVLAGNNWWGCAEGPGAPVCDRIIGLVDVSPAQPLPSKSTAAAIPGTDRKSSR